MIALTAMDELVLFKLPKSTDEEQACKGVQTINLKEHSDFDFSEFSQLSNVGDFLVLSSAQQSQIALIEVSKPNNLVEFFETQNSQSVISSSPLTPAIFDTQPIAQLSNCQSYSTTDNFLHVFNSHLLL